MKNSHFHVLNKPYVIFRHNLEILIFNILQFVHDLFSQKYFILSYN
jgi:hypothetical protein